MTDTVQGPNGGPSLRRALGSSQGRMMFLASFGLSEAQHLVEGNAAQLEPFLYPSSFFLLSSLILQK